jgi:DnaJ like chaperone protein
MQSQLLNNNWFGKAVGATCGWIWAPADPLWLAIAVIAGIGFGHAYDMIASHYWADDNDHATLAKMAASHRQKNSPHLQFLFAALGRVAKSTGPVRPDHIAYVERLMAHMALDASLQAQAKVWFKQGKANSYPLQKLSQECMQATEQGAASRLTILRCLCTIASIQVNDQALSCLKQLSGYLGFAPSRIAREFGDIHKSAQNKSQKQDTAAANDSPALNKAFKYLKIEPGASSAKVKLAYRKLVSKYHPDKLPRNASAKDKQAAQHRMVELRDALDLIQTQER